MDQPHELYELYEVQQQLQNTSSKKEKERILKKCPKHLQELLKLIYEPTKPFHVTSKSVKKYKEDVKDKSEQFIKRLESLNQIELDKFFERLESL